jgi:hypothetical protein
MADKDPQDIEILDAIDSAGADGIDPRQLIEVLVHASYEIGTVIEALQRAMERGKISLNGAGMVIAVREYAHAA